MRFSLPLFSALLISASGYWIAEEAADGRGLYLVVLWGITSVCLCLQRLLQRSEAVRFRGTFDYSLLLLVCGHVLSTWMVFRTGGDRRAALNLTLEWAGLGGIWFLLRHLAAEVRGTIFLREVLTALILGMACYGIWQHHAGFPADAEWYRGRRAELDAALEAPGADARRAAVLVTAEFQRQGVPTEGTGRILWENRVLYSTEPLGPFALTNTLAGLLAVGLILVIGRITGRWQELGRPGWRELSVVIFQSTTIAWCLLLTKSRSAWLGAIVGLVIVAVVRSRGAHVKAVLRWAMYSTVVAGVIAGVVAFGGGLDKEVILESPRSLQFRLLYWTGTMQMLRQTPVYGAGPGNFRQSYLGYKADESSEEIRDPHNIFLDAWSSAGLMGLAGVVLLTGGLVWHLTKRMSENGARQSRGIRTAMGGLIAAGIGLGFLLDIGWEWLSGESFEGKLAQLLLLAGAVVVVLRGPVLDIPDRTVGLAAAAALLIHLFAAGGFEIPVVMMVLAACLVCGIGDVSAVGLSGQGRGSPLRVVSGVTWLLLSLAVVATGIWQGVMPQMRAQWAMAAAESLADGGSELSASQVTALRKAWRVAVDTDPLAVLALQRWAEFETGQLRTQAEELAAQRAAAGTAEDAGRAVGPEVLTNSMEQALAGAIEVCNELIAADRKNSVGYLLRGRCYSLAGQALGDRKWLMCAVSDFETVTERNRGAIEIWLELSKLQRLAGVPEASRRSAERVRQLNAINQEWGHRDQFLSAEDEQQLQDLLKQG